MRSSYRWLAPMVASFVFAACAGHSHHEATHDRAAAQAHDASGHRHDHASDTSPAQRAVAVMMPMGDSGVSGSVTFEAKDEGVQLRGRIRGLTPGKHGFHVHEFGDLTDSREGMSAGDHFAPGNTQHGRPSDSQRHVGDLGNVTAGPDGVAVVDMFDRMLRLDGPHSILGRSLVVHRDEDKFTQPSGDAGPRVAIGVIGIAKPPGK
jgi:superoxide dismutase, Cu-Zn family